MAIDLPNITGKTHHDVEQAILRLREGLEEALSTANAAITQVTMVAGRGIRRGRRGSNGMRGS